MTDPLTKVSADGELLPWLEPAWARLRQAQAADRLPHALLVVGARGLGKRRLATLFARALLCPTPRPDGLACGVCADCRLSAAGSHPDLARVAPDPESKSGEIPIDAIRELTERAVLTPVRGARKVILIDPADRMNAAAANALLKTLEEPAGNTLLMLIAEQPGRLPATIRSRCQLLKLAVPPSDQALAWLTPLLGEAAAPRLRLAYGAPLRALEEFDQATLDSRDTLVRSFIGIGRGELDPVAAAVAWSAAGARLSLDCLADCLCDLLRLMASPAPPRLADPGLAPALAAFAAYVDPGAAQRLLRRVFAARGLLESTINALMQLESLLIEWARVGQRRLNLKETK
ncbi:DNA polymerase III subunit delta' [Candidatus Thiodictyon syntrophicum]|uniref:DNA polymerase III subunit delta' n=2 Tax=Candidatus Thiodictyon syntrophicum TaxID=1166950 RepID=A0A2K8U9P7_9GAMM|nr:DNA polymerase III subunit delta' [Candidatus Thiodictyon syntrophicum]